EIIHSRENTEIFRELAINRFRVTRKKILARPAAIRKDKICRILLLGRAFGFFRELGEEIGAAAPEFRAGGSIAFEVASDSRIRLGPCCRDRGRESCSTKTLRCIPPHESMRRVERRSLHHALRA